MWPSDSSCVGVGGVGLLTGSGVVHVCAGDVHVHFGTGASHPCARARPVFKLRHHMPSRKGPVALIIVVKDHAAGPARVRTIR